MVSVRVTDPNPESTLAGEGDPTALVLEQTAVPIGTDTPYHHGTLARSERKHRRARGAIGETVGRNAQKPASSPRDWTLDGTDVQ